MPIKEQSRTASSMHSDPQLEQAQKQLYEALRRGKQIVRTQVDPAPSFRVDPETGKVSRARSLTGEPAIK